MTDVRAQQQAQQQQAQQQQAQQQQQLQQQLQRNNTDVQECVSCLVLLHSYQILDCFWRNIIQYSYLYKERCGWVVYLYPPKRNFLFLKNYHKERKKSTLFQLPRKASKIR